MPTKSTIRQARYDAENTTRICLKLNRKTDADILSKLDEAKQDAGIQAYIKRLIRADIKKEQAG